MTFLEAGQWLANSLILVFVVGIPVIAFIKGVKVYDAFIEGAATGLHAILAIVPHLIGMLVSIGMFRAAGGFDWLSEIFSPYLGKLGIPKEILPLAFMRPFSGSGSNGLLVELINTHGSDSLIARIGATLMGSTETTFYILAIYFGSIGIKKTRYAVPTGLIADFIGIVAAVWICRWLFS